MKFFLRVLGLGIVTFGSIANADTLYNLMFSPSDLGTQAVGYRLEYLQNITNKPKEIVSEKSVLEFVMSDKKELVITLKRDEKSAKLGSFPSEIGNPVNMYFLERIVDHMSTSAGGSPFYIRNRLKDALLIEANNPSECQILSKDIAKCVSFMPFVKDGARVKMGVFADMKIEMQIDPKNPAHITGLAAQTIDANDYSFTLMLKQDK